MERAASKLEDHRYERKFVISTLTKYEIESVVKLHPAMFLEVYPERLVNNLYFDSFNLKSYFQSVDGLKDRVKIRIRWYGDLFGVIKQPVLELKIKDGLVGRKERFPLIPFSLDEGFQLEKIVEVITKSEIPDVLRLDLISSEISLLNRYRRKYFQSANGKYRMTLDSELEFYPIKARNNTFLHKSVDFVTTVVELKYDPEADEGAKWITDYLPFRMTKSSKYVGGIERLYL